MLCGISIVSVSKKVVSKGSVWVDSGGFGWFLVVFGVFPWFWVFLGQFDDFRVILGGFVVLSDFGLKWILLGCVGLF